ncbi:uncharacterized protein LOC141913002 [Tubulanus polymorphus]|uniref:uncharacterized protein LOC141913002 n=1 Tax=Tubulanus polymorphus TaxID=672921 RepID=UPI003DA1CF97
MAEQEFMQEISDQFLVCKICFETYKRPKTLACLHTFCSACLEKHNDSEMERTTYRYVIFSRSISCPICRKRTDIPSGGIKNLPDNFLVSNLTEVVNKSKPAKKEKDICQICIRFLETSKPACSKCIECAKTMCKDCTEVHKVTKVTKSHNVFDLESQKDIVCKVHEEEAIRFYCKPCESCVCVVCTFQEHRNHEVCSLKEGITEYTDSLNEMVTSCRSRMDHVKNQLVCIEKHATDIKQIEEQINDVTSQVIDSIKAKQTQIVKELKDHFGKDVVNGVERKDELEQLLQTLQHTCSLTEMMLKNKGIDLLLIKRNIRERMESLLQIKVPDIKETKNSPDIKFVKGSVCLGYLDSGKQEHRGSKPSHPRFGSSRFRSPSSPEMEASPNCIAATQTDMCKIREEYTTMDSNMKSSWTDNCIQACIPAIGFDKETITVNESKEVSCETDPVLTSQRNRQTNTEERIRVHTRTQTEKPTPSDKFTNTMEPIPHNKQTNTENRLYFDKQTLTEDKVVHHKHTTTKFETRDRESNTELVYSVESGCNTVSPDMTTTSSGSDFLTFTDEDETSTHELELELLNYYKGLLSSMGPQQYVPIENAVNVHQNKPETIEELDLEPGKFLRGKTPMMNFILESLSAYAQTRETVIKQHGAKATKSTMVPEIIEWAGGNEMEFADMRVKDVGTRMFHKEVMNKQTMTLIVERADSSSETVPLTTLDQSVLVCAATRELGTSVERIDTYSTTTSTSDLNSCMSTGTCTNNEYENVGTSTEHFVRFRNKGTNTKIEFDEHIIESSDEENVFNEIRKRKSRAYSLDDPDIKTFHSSSRRRKSQNEIRKSSRDYTRSDYRYGRRRTIHNLYEDS